MQNKTQHPLIFHISRASLHDGPGVRTVVYFKGCSLSCRWCHNPESWDFCAQIIYHESRCIGCGRCLAVCPEAHILREGRHLFLRSGCVACGKCVQQCPGEALTLCGREYTVPQLYEQIRRDAHFFRQSGGGVTFSGGECLLFPAFLREIAACCKAGGIHTLVESALNVPYSHVEQVLEVVDLFYVDIKHMDSQKHKRYTGAGNETILQNIKQLAQAGKAFVVRVPLIPGVNDDLENLSRTVKFVEGLPGPPKKIELLKYNNLSASKYSGLGKSMAAFAGEPQSNEEMERLCGLLNGGAQAPAVFYTK